MTEQNHLGGLPLRPQQPVTGTNTSPSGAPTAPSAALPTGAPGAPTAHQPGSVPPLRQAPMPATGTAPSLPTHAAPAPAAPAAPVVQTEGRRRAAALDPDDLPGLIPVTTGQPGGAAPVGHRTSGPATPASAHDPGVAEVSEVEDEDQIAIDDILRYMMENGGSDLHLTINMPPAMRVRGEMTRIPGFKPLTASQTQVTLYSIMNAKQKKRFEDTNELDFAYALPNGEARFRVNVFRQRGAMGGVMRTIPTEIKSLEALNLPVLLNQFAGLERGLVLVTGPTGSGKSTTLAAVLDYANRTRRGHIMTIEDPVEFVHQHRACIVNQREIGADTESFAAALKSVLRQDPDIILVGEMRDLETISVALSAAETGHLVLGTLHTKSAQDTITRIVDVFPADQQAQVRTQLAGAIQGIVCQSLCKTLDGNGRQAAVEIMLATPGIRAMIRDDKLQQIQGSLQANGKLGMQTLNQDLANHVKSGRIHIDVALEKCSERSDLLDLLGGEESGRRITAEHLRRMQNGAGMALPGQPATTPGMHPAQSGMPQQPAMPTPPHQNVAPVPRHQ